MHGKLKLERSTYFGGVWQKITAEVELDEPAKLTIVGDRVQQRHKSDCRHRHRRGQSKVELPELTLLADTGECVLRVSYWYTSDQSLTVGRG